MRRRKGKRERTKRGFDGERGGWDLILLQSSGPPSILSPWLLPWLLCRIRVILLRSKYFEQRALLFCQSAPGDTHRSVANAEKLRGNCGETSIPYSYTYTYTSNILLKKHSSRIEHTCVRMFFASIALQFFWVKKIHIIQIDRLCACFFIFVTREAFSCDLAPFLYPLFFWPVQSQSLVCLFFVRVRT